MARALRLGTVVAVVAAAAALLGLPGPAASARSLGVALDDCVVPDNGDPQLVGLRVEPSTVDVTDGPARVTVAVAATDTGGPGPASGVVRVLLVVRSPDPAVEVLRWATRRADGQWAATFPVYPGQPAGAWVVRELHLEDGVGLATWVEPRDLTRRGLPSGFTVTGPVDRASPALRHLRLDRSTVVLDRGGGSVGVRARATDDTFVAGVTVSARNSRTHRFVRADLRADGTGTWAGRLRFRPWNDDGRWRLQATVTDGAGNVRRYGTGPARDRLPGGPEVMTVVGGGRDRVATRIVSSRVAPETLDVRSVDRTVTVRVHLHDTGSGFLRGEARIRQLNAHAPLVRVSGTVNDGVWQARVHVSRCRGVTGTFPVELKLNDAAGNHSGTGSAGDRVAVLAGDHQAPAFSPEMAGTAMPRGGPLVFRWTEDVVGITAASAPLLFDFRRVLDEPMPDPVPGSWTCQTVTGASVDCASGPVRTAAFAPATPLTVHAETHYVLQFNPPGILSVTDLSGNPATPYWFTPS